jgi:hypothetical protein
MDQQRFRMEPRGIKSGGPITRRGSPTGGLRQRTVRLHNRNSLVGTSQRESSSPSRPAKTANFSRCRNSESSRLIAAPRRLKARHSSSLPYLSSANRREALCFLFFGVGPFPVLVLCCGGLFATTSTARSKRAHASGCSSGSCLTVGLVADTRVSDGGTRDLLDCRYFVASKLCHGIETVHSLLSHLCTDAAALL